MNFTEEEKKAIEELKKVDFDTLDDNICVNSMPILLNLIEKLQKHLRFYEKNGSYKFRILELKDEIEKQQKEIEELEREKNNFHNLYCKDHIRVALQEKEIAKLKAQNDKLSHFLLLNDKQWEDKYNKLLKEHTEFYNYIESNGKED